MGEGNNSKVRLEIPIFFFFFFFSRLKEILLDRSIFVVRIGGTRTFDQRFLSSRDRYFELRGTWEAKI